jgi:starch-binding outer membrane protein, SusD/RagB family
MKIRNYLILACLLGTFACKKVTDIYPESNLNTATYYSNLEEVKAALIGCYNGMQRALLNEWQLTELRSDNSKQGQPGSTSSVNRDLSDLDMFLVSPSHAANTAYWQNTYTNIRNINIVLERLGVAYNPSTGAISFGNINIPIKDVDRKQVAGEALFLRAYHYFNLVRLYGGVFLIHKSVTPAEAKAMNRSGVEDIYKLIEADLQTAASSMGTAKYAANSADLGRATSWAAKALLGKVYLTRNKKAEAIPLLQDVRTNSGHGLQATYANVFSTTNEMNNEILFAVRFKAPALGIGSPFSNLFAPLSSGSAVITGDGDGLNYPTADLDTATIGDTRKTTLIGVYTRSSTSRDLYVRKYIPPQPSINDDTENDWPVIRFADVLLMLAEAQGHTQASLDLMNLVRVRSGLPNLTMANTATVAQFEQALSHERRVEFAFENHRWFDLVRYNTTLTTITAEQVIKNHFAKEYQSHYRLYTAPTPTLAQLQANVTRDHLLLPIPQREIDTNTSLQIPQNPGY